MKPGQQSAGEARLEPDSKLECRICWYLYDPEVGDPTWQIPAGTAFLDLPGYWRCPECDTEASAFLPVES